MESRSPDIVILDRYLKVNKNYKIFQNNFFKEKMYIYSIDDSHHGCNKIKNLSTIIVNKILTIKIILILFLVILLLRVLIIC